MRDVTISPEGQITLPKDALEALSAKPGDKLRFFVYGIGEVRILAVRPVSGLFGALQYDGPPISSEDEEEAIARGAYESSSN